MEMIGWAGNLILGRLQSVFNFEAPYGPVALGGAFVFAALYYVDARRRRGRRVSIAGFFRSIFPARILRHPSSRLDVRLWIANTLVFTSAYGMFAIGSLLWRNGTVGLATSIFGPHEPTAWPLWAIPALWEFHKVHHSAEVLTTLTEMRTHPVEIIFFMNAIALCTGIVFGAMTYLFGPGIHPFTLLNANLVLMLFIVTIGHLRHSHMWIAFTGVAGRLFQSPAHHQIHHSDQPRHFNKNLGFALAVWDWLFGTLYVPEKYEKITFGVGAEHVQFDTLLKTFVTPFSRSANHLVKWAGGLKVRASKDRPGIAPAARNARASEG
jgi:sterol desaturase/sphingolipid hydroxylase (fatty acid hydroxylase superfamily)